MDLHERLQFDFLLQVAVERYVERVENVGAERAKLEPFVDAIFGDFLLNNADGACFVLRALALHEQKLIAMAKVAFVELMRSKTEESLELRKIS
jgi:hypothetical protein